jgi:hypothetical protein
MKNNGNLTRGERLQIMLSPEELAVVDDFRFKQRMPSRAAAVRELFKLGLTVATQSPALAGQKSTDFGVLEATSNGGSRFRKKPIGTQVRKKPIGTQVSDSG